MRILIADDNAAFRHALQEDLTEWGHEPVSAADGVQAWQILQEPNPPRLAVLDWMMPGLDGVEVCQLVRADQRMQGLYLILLTARRAREDLVRGLEAGADEYVRKPVDFSELRARINTGLRTLTLQAALTSRLQELEAALHRLRRLEGLLPLCCYCKKVRESQNYWRHVDEYLTERGDLAFTHGICPTCMETIVETELRTAPTQVQQAG